MHDDFECTAVRARVSTAKVHQNPDGKGDVGKSYMMLSRDDGDRLAICRYYTVPQKVIL